MNGDSARVAPPSTLRRGSWRDQYAARTSAALALASFLGFGVVAALVTLGDTTAFDVGVTLALQSLRTPPLYWLMFAVSWPGFIPRSMVIAAGIVLGFIAARRFLEARFLVLAYLLTILGQLVKLLSHRARPVTGTDGIVVYGTVTGYSFPSGHVLSYTLILGLLACFASSLSSRARIPLLGFLLAGIVLVGPSRLYLGQHWFSDVLGSYLLGIALLIPLVIAYRLARARRLDRPAPAPAAAAPS